MQCFHCSGKKKIHTHVQARKYKLQFRQFHMSVKSSYIWGLPWWRSG